MTPTGPDGGDGPAPTVSIVLPVFNGADGLAASLAALDEQTFEDVEVLVVDDGSTDGTAEILRAHAPEHPQVRVLTQDRNRGVAVARNTALAAARGRYVWLVDHDDRWSADFLAVMVGAAERSGADVVVCGADRTRPDGTRTGVAEAARAWSSAEPGAYLRGLLTGDVTGYLWSKLFRREVFGPNPFPPLTSQSDFAGQVLLADRVRSVVGLDRTLYQHVIREGSITRSTPKMHNLVSCGQIADAVAAPSLGRQEPGLLRYFHVWFVHLAVLNTALRLGARDDRSLELVRTSRRAIGRRDVLAAARFSKAVAVRALAVRLAWPLYERVYAVRRRVLVRRAERGGAEADMLADARR